MSFVLVGVAVVGLVGAGASAYGQYQQGQSTKKWNDYNASVQRENAKAVLDQSNQQAEQKRAQGEQTMARQRVLYAKAGLDLSGTPTDVILGTAGEVENDAQLIIQKGQVGYVQDNESAAMSEGQGSDAATSGMLQASGTLLSGLGKAGGQAYTAYKQ